MKRTLKPRKKVAAVVGWDRHVGERVRLRRNMLMLSQEKLGEAIGLTFQQVQKYERGTNRVSAGKLQQIADVLRVPLGFFYDDRDPVHAPPMVDDPPDDPLNRPDSQEMLAAYRALRNEHLQAAFAALLRSLPRAVIEVPAPKKKRQAA